MQTNSLLKGKHGTFRAILMVMLLSLSSILTASAKGSGTKEDPYIFESGATYHVDAFKSFYGKFTAPTDGKLSINKTIYSVYTDETFETIDENVQLGYRGNASNPAWTVDCTAGKTYYLGNNFVMDAIDFTFTFGTGAPPPEIVEVSPAAGTVFNAGSGIVNIEFTENVTIASATMTAGTAVKALQVNVNGAYASVEVKDLITELYDNGQLKEGDDIKFTFSGVASQEDSKVLYNGTGVIEVVYKAGQKPLRLVSTSGTPNSATPVPNFYSYYMANGNAGIVTLNFSGDVNMNDNMKPVATLIYGNSEAEDQSEFYTEPLDIHTLGGSTIMLNLKGKLRRAKDMVTSGQNYGTVRIRVANVRDTDGNYAYAEGSGTLGSFDYVYNFQEVTYTADVDWTLSDEATAIGEDTKSIELWLGETGGQAGFDGTLFTYTAGGVEKTKTVKLGEMTVTDVDDGERTITIPIPNISADAGSKITVAMTGIERPDGLTTDKEETAFDYLTKTFDTTGRTSTALEITSAVWHNGDSDVNMDGADIAVLTEGTTSTIKTNKDSEIGHVIWEIRGTNNPDMEYVRSGYLNGPIEDGIVIEWHNEALDEGNDYTFTLQAWKSEDDKNSGAEPNVGETVFTIHGAKKAYQYSDVTLNTDISESFVLASAEENTKTFEFSAPVTMTAIVNTGSGTDMNCEIEQADADGKQWTVTFPQYVLANFEAFDVNIFAKDADGRSVNKTANGLGTVIGNDDNVWFEVHFTAEYNKPDFTILPATGSELESISKLTFIYEPEIAQDWNCTEKITVYNRGTRQIVGEYSGDDIELDFDDYSKAYLTLTEPITEPGTYDITIPASFFMLGESMFASNNREATVTYVVKGASKPLTVVIDPAAGNVTEIPATLVVTLPDNDTAGYKDDKVPTLTDDKGKSYTTHFEWGAAWNQLNIVLDEGAITANGTYTLTIPAGSIEYDDDPDNVNTDDIVFVYVIGTADSISGIFAAEGIKANVYTADGKMVIANADAAALKTLGKGLYIINGKKVIIR